MTLANPTAGLIAQRRMLPYGEQRGSTSGTWADGMDRGFVGGTKDPTGLTHLGAREYDPFLGRFISLDPLLDYADPQTLERGIPRLELTFIRDPDPSIGDELLFNRDGDKVLIIYYLGDPDDNNTCKFSR